MTDDQVLALAKVVQTRCVLEDATADHDEAAQAALRLGVSLRVVASSSTVSWTTLSRRREAREAAERRPIHAK